MTHVFLPNSEFFNDYKNELKTENGGDFKFIKRNDHKENPVLDILGNGVIVDFDYNVLHISLDIFKKKASYAENNISGFIPCLGGVQLRVFYYQEEWLVYGYNAFDINTNTFVTTSMKKHLNNISFDNLDEKLMHTFILNPFGCHLFYSISKLGKIEYPVRYENGLNVFIENDATISRNLIDQNSLIWWKLFNKTIEDISFIFYLKFISKNSYCVPKRYYNIVKSLKYKDVVEANRIKKRVIGDYLLSLNSYDLENIIF